MPTNDNLIFYNENVISSTENMLSTNYIKSFFDFFYFNLMIQPGVEAQYSVLLGSRCSFLLGDRLKME